MKFTGTLVIEVNVVDVKTFDRRSKEIGQEVVFMTDKGYRCNVSACDVSIEDFRDLEGIHKFFIEPCTSYDQFVSSKGTQYGKNYPSFIITGLAD